MKTVNNMVIAFLIIVLICLCGCTDETPDRVSDAGKKNTSLEKESEITSLLEKAGEEIGWGSTDTNRTFSRFFGNMAVSPEAMYFIDKHNKQGNFKKLMYIDRKTGFCGPLCGKPECQHHSGECNSNTGSNTVVLGLSFYENKLYWLSECFSSDAGYGWNIFRIDPDGFNRELVRTISTKNGKDTEIPGGNTEVFFHRGYLFVCGELSFGNISQGEFQHETRVLAYSLVDEKQDYIIDECKSESAVYVRMQPYQDDLYFFRAVVMPKDNEIAVDRFTVGRFSITSGTTEILCDRNQETRPGFIPIDLWVNDTEILFTSESGQIYSLDKGRGAITLLPEFSQKREAYGFPDIFEERILYFGTDHYLLYDREGNYMGKIAHPEFSACTLLGADTYALYYYAEEEDRDVLGAVLHDGSGSIILWQSER